MTDYSKNRVLALFKILINYTDEQHQISMQDILGYMEAEGHFCSEDSILRYIKQLRNELGVDVISSRGRNAQYFIGDRLLENEEMRLIIDSVNASNFIEKSIATKIIDKLKSTMSIYDSEELDRNVLGINIAKAENRKILYNVNLIQEALNKGVQIIFDYMGWNRNKKLVKKSDRRYNMNPWALIWANDRYYLYGYDVKETQGVLYERHYRVDKLDKNKNGQSVILATQRGYGEFKGGWEFPGGKIEPGETPQEALIREIKEELDTKISSVEKLIDTVEYDYDTFHLSMACYWCSLESDKIILKEHEAARWLTQDELYNVEWLPADISIVDSVRDEMKQDKNK